jgi:hypothetical protein
LTPSSGKELEYVVENLVTDKATSNRIVLNHLDAASILDIMTVSKFLDVFPELLSGMPPGCEIKFFIELIPGTALIFKSPYRMATNQLSELKEQLQELLDRDISTLVHHHGGAPAIFVPKKDGM